MSSLKNNISLILIISLIYLIGFSCVSPEIVFGEIIPVYNDEELVQNSDIIILGEQKDAITVKVINVLKGTFLQDIIVLEELAKYSRDVSNKENKIEGKLFFTEVLLFINCRSVPYSLVPSGVKRFSFENSRRILFSYINANDKGGYKLILDPESAKKENYIEDIKYLSTKTKFEYEMKLREYLKNMDTSTQDGIRPFIQWARMHTRWGYTAGLDALLTVAKDYTTDAYLDAVTALLVIRDPSTSKPLMDYINTFLDEKILFDHIRAVGAIGGPNTLPFLIRLSTYKEDKRHVRCGAIHGLRLLYPQLQNNSVEAKALVASILPTDFNNVPICLREALVAIANDETKKALELYAENRKAEGDKSLYDDAIEFIQKLKEKIQSNKENNEKIASLKVQEW
jgi:hypothetical protein